MNSSRLTRRTVAVLAAGLAAATGLAVLAPATASAGSDEATHASLTFTAAGAAQFHVQGGRIHPGTVVIRVRNEGMQPHSFLVLSLNGKTRLSKVLQDIKADMSGGPAGAAATVALTREAHFVGGTDVGPGQSSTYTTVGLPRGTYYALDFGRRGPIVLGSVRVLGETYRSDAPAVSVKVFGNTADHFAVSSTTLPARGTVLFRNVSDTIHFMDIQPVKKGTTDAEIQKFFDGHGKPPFMRGPSAATEVVSPGVAEKLSYRLPAGDYVLLCFVTDDMTGAPHAVMGMHKVVHLR